MSDIRCPHCGDEREHDIDDYGDDGDTEIKECGNCGEEFEVEMSISYSWSTRCVPGKHKLSPSNRHPGWFNCEVCDEFIQDDGSPKIEAKEEVDL